MRAALRPGIGGLSTDGRLKAALEIDRVRDKRSHVVGEVVGADAMARIEVQAVCGQSGWYRRQSPVARHDILSGPPHGAAMPRVRCTPLPPRGWQG